MSMPSQERTCGSNDVGGGEDKSQSFLRIWRESRMAACHPHHPLPSTTFFTPGPVGTQIFSTFLFAINSLCLRHHAKSIGLYYTTYVYRSLLGQYQLCFTVEDFEVQKKWIDTPKASDRAITHPGLRIPRWECVSFLLCNLYL